MPKVSKGTASHVEVAGAFEDRSEDLAGYTVNFLTLNEDGDQAALYKGLPDDRCQCPHWGYVFKGKLIFNSAEGQEVIEAGEAFYIPAGHTPAGVAGTEFLLFSPAEEMAKTDEAMRRNLEAMQSA